MQPCRSLSSSLRSLDSPAKVRICQCRECGLRLTTPHRTAVKDETSVKTIMAAQYRTMNRGGHSIYEEVRKAGFEP